MDAHRISSVPTLRLCSHVVMGHVVYVVQCQISITETDNIAPLPKSRLQIYVVRIAIHGSGSLPEILNYLPDGGKFSWVPVLLRIQVKFLFQIHVRQIIQYKWNHFSFLKKRSAESNPRKQSWVQTLRPVNKHTLTLFSNYVKRSAERNDGYSHYCSRALWVLSKFLEFPPLSTPWLNLD